MGEEESKEAPKTGIAAMIPEFYYDLIARVPAGSLLVLFVLGTLLSARDKPFPNISIWLTANSVPILILVSIVMGIGGLVGILISPVASVFRHLYWKRSWLAIVEKEPYHGVSFALTKAGYKALPAKVIWSALRDSDFHGIDRWIYDFLQRESSVARTILPKLRAEADLGSYLAASFFLMPVFHISLAGLIFLLSRLPSGTSIKLGFHAEALVWYGLSWTITVLLCFSGAYRTKRLILRMLSMLSVISESTQTQFHPHAASGVQDPINPS